MTGGRALFSVAQENECPNFLGVLALLSLSEMVSVLKRGEWILDLVLITDLYSMFVNVLQGISDNSI